MQFQTDFELFFNIHNSENKNLFTYANTKVFPVEINPE